VSQRANSSPDGFRFFDKDRTAFFFDPEAEPITELESGERIVVRTRDSVCGLAKAEAPRGFHIDDLVSRAGGACPVTGPFAVRGATPGTLLEVEFHRVDPHPPEGQAWTGVFQGFGALASETYSLQDPLEPETRLLRYQDGVATLDLGDRSVDIPLHPFLGTVGVAPRSERRMTFSQSPEYLGDVDLSPLTRGATLVLPVNVDGALLGLGDAHAAQGDGEITGAAIEIEAEVEITVRVVDAGEVAYASLPQINTGASIGSVAGFHGVHLGDCARAAYVDLVKRLVRGHGFTETHAYELLGQVGRLQVGNMIDPFYSVLASVDREYLD
jgi:acetamidase/formamidase